MGKKGTEYRGPRNPSDTTGCSHMFEELDKSRYKIQSVSWESSEKRKSQKFNGKEERKEMGSQIAGH